MKRNLFPVFVLLIILGIIAEKYARLNTELAAILLLILFSVYFGLRFIPKSINSPRIVSLILIPIFTGVFFYSFSLNHKVCYPFDKLKIPHTESEGVITDIRLFKKDKITLEFKLERMNIDSVKAIRGKTFLVNIYDTAYQLRKIYDKINVGNVIKLKGTVIAPRGKRNPFEFDYAEYLYSKGISRLINVYAADDIIVVSKESDLFAGSVHHLRTSIDNAIHSLYGEQTAGLIRGLILADRSEIDYTLRTKFVNAGVIHVLAVSGLHVGYILLIFVFMFGRFNIFLRYSLTILGLMIFLVITGMPTSVVRASLMSIIVLISFLTGRRYNMLNSVALAALILLIFNPDEIFNPGFQLSFSAVLSIYFITPALTMQLKNYIPDNSLLRNVIFFALVSLSAQLGTLPFTLYYFHKLSLSALAANIIVIPGIGLILAVGIMSLFLFPVWFRAAEIFAAAGEGFSHLLFKIVDFFGGLSFSYNQVSHFSLINSLIYFSVLILIGFIIIRIKKLMLKIPLLLLSISIYFIFSGLTAKSFLPRNNLTVIAIDVGQGDSFFINSASGEKILIDCGNATKHFDNGARTILPLLQNLNVEKLDYVFISHLDRDHYGGFYSLERSLKIDSVYFPKPFNNRRTDSAFIDSLKKYRVNFAFYRKRKILLGNTAVYILNDTAETELNFNNRNDNSGLVKIVFGNNSILFTGDLSAQAEKVYGKLYSAGLQSDILKVGHHGSAHSTSLEFLDNVHPQTALISVGAGNKFHHPSEEVIEKLKSRGIKIFRTDKLGALIFISNGNSWRRIDWRKDW